jgi:hypothetical protein
VVGHLLPPPPFPLERGSVRATWADPPSRILPRDVSVPVRATWAGTSSRPSLLLPPQPPSRTAPRPSHASRPATGAAPRVPRRAYNRESSPPLPLHLPYSSARIGPNNFLSIIIFPAIRKTRHA